jgi:hypothetical protein
MTSRMLSFAYKRFDGVVPEPGELDADRAPLEKVEAGFETVGELCNACKFRAALNEALALATHPLGGGPGSRGCEATAKLTRSVSPGSQIKEDAAGASEAGVALQEA